MSVSLCLGWIFILNLVLRKSEILSLSLFRVRVRERKCLGNMASFREQDW